MRRLREAGYRVNLRMRVGHFRIGMVVEGEDERRLAIECDGDRYCSLDALADDAARQGVLERLGWQFVRIRGTVFHRDPEAALRRVFDRLAELGIEPMADAVSSHADERTSGPTLVDELEELSRAVPGTAAAAGLPPVPAVPKRRIRKHWSCALTNRRSTGSRNEKYCFFPWRTVLRVTG